MSVVMLLTSDGGSVRIDAEAKPITDIVAQELDGVIRFGRKSSVGRKR